ncbi:hypothetical protein B0H13DRAFT_402511 [Mycena leptocephala]|nr:hypothetical protein B0H13DRAFT_402511 [Mycena leptocephala]
MPMRRPRRRVLRQHAVVPAPVREPRAHKPSRRRVLRFGAHMVLRHRAREGIHGYRAREGGPSYVRGTVLAPAALVVPLLRAVLAGVHAQILARIPERVRPGPRVHHHLLARLELQVGCRCRCGRESTPFECKDEPDVDFPAPSLLCSGSPSCATNSDTSDANDPLDLELTSAHGRDEDAESVARIASSFSLLSPALSPSLSSASSPSSRKDEMTPAPQCGHPAHPRCCWCWCC